MKRARVCSRSKRCAAPASNRGSRPTKRWRSSLPRSHSVDASRRVDAFTGKHFMAYDLEEQEQIASIKAWWNDYGKMVMLVVIGALVAVAGFQGWRYYRNSQSERAATLYIQLSEAERANDSKRV